MNVTLVSGKVRELDVKASWTRDLVNLNKWAKGKPLGLVMMAEQFAVSVGACFEFLRLIKAGEKIEAVSSVPKDKEWVWLYRNHRRIERSLLEGFKRFDGVAGLGAYFIGSFPDNLSYTRNQRSTIKRNLTMVGVNLRTVQTLLGHKDLRMTMRYSQLSPEHL
jgi:hypothetical protein